jgi:hypothetical protein
MLPRALRWLGDRSLDGSFAGSFLDARMVPPGLIHV